MSSSGLPPNPCYELLVTGSCATQSTCFYDHATSARLCLSCNHLSLNANDYTTHLRTQGHMKLKQQKTEPDIPKNCHWCSTCRCIVSPGNNSEKMHNQGAQHRRKSQVASLRLQYLNAQTNVNWGSSQVGIQIDGNGDFGMAEAGLDVARIFFVRATSGVFKLLKIAFISLQPGVATIPFKLWNQSTLSQSELTHAKTIELRVSFQHNTLGRYTCELELTLQSQETKKLHVVTKTLKAVIGDSEAHEELKPRKPFAARPPTSRQEEKSVVVGAEHPSLSTIRYKVRLPPARIPEGLGSAVAQGSMSQVLAAVRKSYLPKKLGGKSYAPYFKILLWIEEAKAEEDMLMYDMEGVRLEPHKGHHWLEVPGLAEKRPSVMLGDQILIRRQTDQDGHWFEGRVWDVQQLRVDLRLPGKAAKITAENPCDVRFKLNRIPLQRQHQALDITGIPDRITFPRLEHVYAPVTHAALRLFTNPLVGNNPRQRDAVKSIISQPAGSIPFIVFGPPGTGKTVTVVEAINQILRHDANARILACAPSNPAADIIAHRLMPLGNDKLFRLYAPSRHKKTVDEDMLPFTFTHKNGSFSVPALAQLMSFRVVVSTCVSASIPFGVGVPKGHFTHIFIDEAGQATEPEAMVSIRTMLGPRTNIVLSGDPKQLGPVIRSGVAREFGLGKSYLERLMENTLYDESTGSTESVVKLTKNFRSHNAILHFPNQEFYRGDLEPCGDARVINAFVNSRLLPKPGFPVVFYAIPGKDERESTSPSFFNIHEITAVKEYVQQLKNLRIADEDIGVVAPYRAQCQKIRKALKDLAGGIKIGSAEEFQGDERLVMIISTVRSSEDFLEYDARFTLGFVSNPRRFNVAVTRAKALLLVVGDPRVLSLDPLWRAFMNYVYDNGGWKGMKPDWDTTAPVDQDSETYAQQRRDSAKDRIAEITARLHSLNVEDDPAGVDRPAFVELE